METDQNIKSVSEITDHEWDTARETLARFLGKYLSGRYCEYVYGGGLCTLEEGIEELKKQIDLDENKPVGPFCLYLYKNKTIPDLLFPEEFEGMSIFFKTGEKTYL